MATDLTKPLDCYGLETLEKESMVKDCVDEIAKRVYDPCAIAKLQEVIDAINNLEISGGGGGVSFEKDYTVDETSISAFRAVVISSNGLSQIKYAQPDDVTKVETIGITKTSGNMGAIVTVQCDGFLTDGSFSGFTVGCPVFATSDGQLTNVMPTFVDGEYILRVGRYVGHNTIEIEIEEPNLISLCP